MGKKLSQIDISAIDRDLPVLIAGPTASGKSALALEIAQAQGGVIINADASQVFDGWRVLTARPDAADEARAEHILYGHVPFDSAYSAGKWLRDVAPLLNREGKRAIIVGGTGLYFLARVLRRDSDAAVAIAEYGVDSLPTCVSRHRWELRSYARFACTPAVERGFKVEGCWLVFEALY